MQENNIIYEIAQKIQDKQEIESTVRNIDNFFEEEE